MASSSLDMQTWTDHVYKTSAGGTCTALPMARASREARFNQFPTYILAQFVTGIHVCRRRTFSSLSALGPDPILNGTQFVQCLQVELEGGMQTNFRSEHFLVFFSFRVTLPQTTIAHSSSVATFTCDFWLFFWRLTSNLGVWHNAVFHFRVAPNDFV